jgi:hypothetical protein
VDFVNSDGVDLADRPVFQTPGDDMFNRVEHLSHEVRNASAVSFHDSRRAQRARKSM